MVGSKCICAVQGLDSKSEEFSPKTSNQTTKEAENFNDKVFNQQDEGTIGEVSIDHDLIMIFYFNTFY